MPKTFTEPQPYADEPCSPIPLKDVKSNQVKSIGYDESTQTLAVIFAHGAGAIYHYPDVKQDVYDAFIGAKSIGQFFGQHIRQLPFKKYPGGGNYPMGGSVQGGSIALTTTDSTA